MARKYFGTDGIRGVANTAPMTASVALNVAMAAAKVLSARYRADGAPVMNRVVIGKDTRLSGYMIEQAMAAGFAAMGFNVIRTGPIPTPAIARLTVSLRADIGVVISASHNPYHDNGIKLFGAEGYKLSDDIELEIERQLESGLEKELPPPDKIGKAVQLNDAGGRYLEYIKRAIPKNQNLSGLKVVVDCANGAAYKVAPQLFWELEAEVISIADRPDGKNINHECGATSPAALQERVVAEKADIGLALDGDADRLIVVDEKGKVIDGDQLMAAIAIYKKKSGFLKGGVVATVMSNLGLERFFEAQEIAFKRTQVGDRYVVEEMRRSEFNIGGEQSGHIVLSDFATTGDGLLAALQVLAILKDSQCKASEAFSLFDPVPQLLKNVRYEGKSPLERTDVKSAMDEAQKELAERGRLLVRASGTEPVIRVMVECDDKTRMEEIVARLCTLISAPSQEAKGSQGHRSAAVS